MQMQPLESHFKQSIMTPVVEASPSTAQQSNSSSLFSATYTSTYKHSVSQLLTLLNVKL